MSYQKEEKNLFKSITLISLIALASLSLVRCIKSWEPVCHCNTHAHLHIHPNPYIYSNLHIHPKSYIHIHANKDANCHTSSNRGNNGGAVERRASVY